MCSKSNDQIGGNCVYLIHMYEIIVKYKVDKVKAIAIWNCLVLLWETEILDVVFILFFFYT